MAQTQATLENLAATVVELSKSISSSLKSQGLEAPSFAADSPNYPPNLEVQGPRMMLIETLSNMLYLAMGPTDVALMRPAFECISGFPPVATEASVLDGINQFDFYSAVPVDGSASYADIAKSAKLPETIVRRIRNYSMTIHMFAEETQGSDRVVHTSATAQVAKVPAMRSFIGHHLEENGRASVELGNALRKFSQGKNEATDDVHESAWALADISKTGRPQTPWEYFEENPVAGTRFFEAMAVISRAGSMKSEDVLCTGFDWAALGHATVVDVGGSSGHEAVFLAQQYPNLTLVVQDRPGLEAAFRSKLPKELAPRVSFEVHNFFEPQIRPADVYFFKLVFHDWPDKDSVSILRNLLPTPRPGGRIIICDAIMPPTYDEHGKPVLLYYVWRLKCAIDITMLQGNNSKERSLDEWEKLFRQADERLKIAKVTIIPGAPLNLIEVVLNE